MQLDNCANNLTHIEDVSPDFTFTLENSIENTRMIGMEANLRKTN
jgi:hypothetical protein